MLYNKYHDEIWDLIDEERQLFGMLTCMELIVSLNGAKDIGSDAQFKNLLVWYAAERIAFELTDGIYIDEDE